MYKETLKNIVLLESTGFFGICSQGTGQEASHPLSTGAWLPVDTADEEWMKEVGKDAGERCSFPFSPQKKETQNQYTPWN